MADEYEFYVQASVCGYHAYFVGAMVYIGEVMDCKMEPENDRDRYAVAVRNKDEKTVGHVPVELSKIFHKFLSRHGQIEAEYIGSRFNAGQGKGLELPVDRGTQRENFGKIHEISFSAFLDCFRAF